MNRNLDPRSTELQIADLQQAEHDAAQQAERGGAQHAQRGEPQHAERAQRDGAQQAERAQRDGSHSAEPTLANGCAGNGAAQHAEDGLTGDCCREHVWLDIL